MTILGQIGRLEIVIEREGKNFGWVPKRHGHIERNPFWIDYCNYYWFLDVYWLRWRLELIWQKTRIGWNKVWPDDPDPWIWFGVQDEA